MGERDSVASGDPITVLSTFPEALLSRVAEAVPGVRIIGIPGDGDLDEDIRGEVLLIPPWDSGNLEAVMARGINWVHTIGTGVDRMPLDLLGDTLLTCARGASAIPIAEWAIAVMLAHEKQLPETWISEPPENWSGAQLGSLYGKSLGLVGFGGIGSALARHALNFGMTVRAFRKTTQAVEVAGVELVKSLEELMATSDHIVLGIPLTPDTHHLVDAEVLAAIPQGAGVHFVNPSRGALVDHEALREALDDGRISRASLDTVEPEPLPEGHWLYSHPRVKLSAHISWSMPGAFDLLLDTFIENLIAFRDGSEMSGIVDRELGY